MQYDLGDRTIKFSKNVVKLLKTIKQSSINRNIISQLLRSATSIGANYCEANNASSKKDFRNKMYISKKEIQETKYWIELLAETNKEKKKELRVLWQEAHELSLIFNKICNSLNKKSKF
ncbi:MAG: four helix bundle protein [Patescibacteria group bacterium]|nr:four helix bundle protein [Patescibacteria group bacterium]